MMHLPVLSVTKLENYFNSIFLETLTICAELNVELD